MERRRISAGGLGPQADKPTVISHHVSCSEPKFSARRAHPLICEISRTTATADGKWLFSRIWVWCLEGESGSWRRGKEDLFSW